jgi:hypothetical protein
VLISKVTRARSFRCTCLQQHQCWFLYGYEHLQICKAPVNSPISSFIRHSCRSNNNCQHSVDLSVYNMTATVVVIGMAWNATLDTSWTNVTDNNDVSKTTAAVLTWTRMIGLAVVLFSLALVTTVGNAMVLYAVRTEKRLQTVSSTLLQLSSQTVFSVASVGSPTIVPLVMCQVGLCYRK